MEAIAISGAGQVGPVNGENTPPAPARVAFPRGAISVAGLSYTGSLLPPGEGKNVRDPAKKDASLDSGFNYSRSTFIGLFTTEVYSGYAFFDYKLTPQLKIGAAERQVKSASMTRTPRNLPGGARSFHLWRPEEV